MDNFNFKKPKKKNRQYLTPTELLNLDPNTIVYVDCFRDYYDGEGMKPRCNCRIKRYEMNVTIFGNTLTWSDYDGDPEFWDIDLNEPLKKADAGNSYYHSVYIEKLEK